MVGPRKDGGEKGEHLKTFAICTWSGKEGEEDVGY
jgi:hypothetical protein